MVRARPAPAVPGIRREVRGNRLGLRVRLHALRPDRAVAPAVDLLDFAPRARVAQRLVAPHARVSLVAHLHHAPRAERGLQHQLALLHGARERLLHVHVLPGVHAVDGDVRVRVVGRAHLHRLELVAHRLQHLAVVGELRDAGILLLPVVEHRRVDVADRHEVAPRADEALRRPAAHAAAADGGDLQAPPLDFSLEGVLRREVHPARAERKPERPDSHHERAPRGRKLHRFHLWFSFRPPIIP